MATTAYLHAKMGLVLLAPRHVFTAPIHWQRLRRVRSPHVRRLGDLGYALRGRWRRFLQPNGHKPGKAGGCIVVEVSATQRGALLGGIHTDP